MSDSSTKSSSSPSRKKRKHSRRKKSSFKDKYARVIFATLLLVILATGIFYLVKVDQVKTAAGGGFATIPGEEPDLENKDTPDLEKLLANGTTEELLEALVVSQSKRAKRNPLMNYVDYSQRGAIAERLLLSKLTESKDQYIALTYVESLMAAELVNTAGKLGFDESRDKALQVGRRYENDPRSEIAGAANLVPIMIPLYDYWAEKDLSHLDLFRAEFDRRHPIIFRDQRTATIFVATVFRLNHDAINSSETTSLLMHIFDKFENQSMPETAGVLQSFRDLLFFADMDVPSLPELVRKRGPFADEQARRLVDVLGRNPNAGIRVWGKAIELVGAYREIGEDQRADLFEKRLRTTAMKIADTEKQEKVLGAIVDPATIAEDMELEPDFGVDLPKLPDMSEIQPDG